MYEFTIGGKNVSVFPGSVSDAPVIYLNTYSDESQQVFRAAQAAGCPPFTLVAISNLDWNHDMAPRDSLRVGRRSPREQTTTCDCCWGISCQGQRRT